MYCWALHASLAQVDGRRTLPGLNAPVRIERDHLGVPTLIKLLVVWIYIRPPATAGVLCVTSPKGFFAKTLNRSEASTTTTSPFVETQNRRPSTQSGELKKRPPTRSCQFTSPEAAWTQLTITTSLH